VDAFDEDRFSKIEKNELREDGEFGVTPQIQGWLRLRQQRRWL
jgi:hypothetical protein